jgi:HTH-type transcriptional regulator, cell division transcriptional repressor
LDNRVDSNGISLRLKQIRHKFNLTPSQVSQITGISTGNLSELENGKYPPSAKTLILLSELYVVSTDWILKGTHTAPEDASDYKNPLLIQNKEIMGVFQKISKLWFNGDRDIQGWILIQLRLAFSQIPEEIKQKHDKNYDNDQNS